GPAVTDDVMHGKEKLVSSVTQLQQLHAQQWRVAQIERTSSFLAPESISLLLLLIEQQTSQVDQLQLQPQLGSNLLCGLSGGIDKTRTQGIMPPHKLVDTLLQRRESQRSDQPHAAGNVV